MSSYTGVITIPYTFSTTTTNSDPGSGNLRLNSASQASSTAIYASDTDANGVDWTAALEGVTAATIRLFDPATPGNWMICSWSFGSAPTGYQNITMTVVAFSAGSPFANSESIIMAVDIMTVVGSSAGANITIDAAGTGGSSTTASNQGHGHELVTYSSNPAALGTASPGSAGTAPARGNHVHPTTGLPLGTLGEAQSTTTQGSITSITDLTALSASGTVASGHRIRVSAIVNAQSTVADDVMELSIREGSTTLQVCDATCRIASVGTTTSCFVYLTPTAGSHTYKLSLARVSGSGTLSTNSSSTAPSQILIEDIGS